MAQLVASDEIQSLELSKTGRSSSFRGNASSSRCNSSNISSSNDVSYDEEIVLKWAAVDRLPTFERLRSSLFDQNDDGKQVIDVSKLGAQERRLLIDRLIKQIENDNHQLLTKIRKRADKVGVKFPSVELRYKNLTIEAECEVVLGKPLPTLWNSFKTLIYDISKVPGLTSQKAKISIVNDVSGVIKPGRMTLLLGPPGCGKTSFLKALSGNLNKSLQFKGEVLYNGYKLEEFVPQKSSAYISQNDVHIPQMTVRETIDFSARCQGIGTRLELLIELSRREKEAGIVPDPDIDTYMKAISVEGQMTSLQTDYILKILGLDICADILVGDAMRRGISGGQKKRLTTGEMIVGPTKALFMDEISNGLDSSTTYQIIACLQQSAHNTDATILISLLQPAPETFDLFDDIILMSEGNIVYHGPRDNILHFFDECGFRCPARKGVADFLQEVISRKDQAQYWHRKEQTHSYVSVDILSRKFKESKFGKNLNEELCKPVLKSEIERKAISFDVYSLSKGALFRACISREFLLMQRNAFIYIFKSVQLFFIALITCTVFFRTQMEINSLHANYYLGALFYAVLTLIVDGLPEVAMTVARLQVFYKQRDLYFYPAWAYTIPAAILKIPISILESLVWTSLTYYMIGYSPEASRFFRQLILLFAVHLTSLSMFRFLASIFQTLVASTAACSFATLFLFLFAGFMIPRPYMPAWIKWAFWICPISYGEIGLAVNEFHAPRWQKMVSTNSTIGKQTLASRGLDFSENYFWVSLAALFGFSIFFNVGFTLALTFLKPRGSRAIISKEKLSQLQGSREPLSDNHIQSHSQNLMRNITPKKGRMVLPFEPLTVVFQDVQYYVDTPMEMRNHGFAEKKLQLLHNITGAFRPGVLTALMGVSGAGKTTLLDVLSGRKTSGTIEGQVKIGGYPKVQETFARVSGYCEQTDIHSPQITVEESLIFSAWLRLDPQIDSKSKYEFVKEVLETIELDGMKDALVGLPGVNGLSTEQRKRLTIAVELVANPSIIFMDEPTTGLDARSAAIVMRAVKNVVDTGRTIVCTIHQPSIDIFESFDELILLKSGGRIIYSGPLGQHSSTVIDYFEGISGLGKIESNCNPATWILELTSTSSEAKLGLDFAQIYKKSALHEKNEELVNSLSVPQSSSKELKFTSRYSQNGWGQFKSCLWKQRLSYWRSPSYNLTRFVYMLLSSSLFGILYWDQGRKIKDEQGMLNVIGAMYAAVIFCGINNGSSVMPYVTTERNVLNRERFSGMYASCAYAFAQVIIEIPYIFSYSLLYIVITYPMIGYYWSISKVLWYLYTMFCSLLQYNYLGMLLVSITPNFPLAAVVSSCFYTMFNLFAGFLIPLPQIPKWWIWLYYLIPTSWTLNGMVTSQFGDIDTQITVLGETKSVSEFLKDRFGFQHNHLPLVVVVMTLYPLVFASLFAYFIGRLNFQRR